MQILAVSSTQENTVNMENILMSAFPKAEIATFIDPLMVVKYALSREIDLVVCNYQLRIIDGIQLIKMLRKQNESIIPILIEEKEQHRKDAENLGIGYLEQPVNKIVFQQLYRRALQTQMEDML